MTDDDTIVVIGAGITGLTAAHTLSAQGRRVTLLDAADRVGGRILSSPFAGHMVDCGADAFLARVPDAVELCRELGLDHLLTSPASSSAHVWTAGALRRLPAGLVLGVPTDLEALGDSGIISADGLARAAEDLDRTEWPEGEPGPDPEGADDRSVGDLVRSRLGDEVFERLVAPLLSGVNAGDADVLSLATGAAQLAAAARREPSLIRSLRQQQEAARASGADPQAPVFAGLPGGTQMLTDTLRAELERRGGDLRLGVAATGLRHEGHRWMIDTTEGTLPAAAVVLALPAAPSARLLAPHAPEGAAELARLEYASVAMITLAVRRADLACDLDGSGFLVALTDRLPALTACSWASSKWAHLADPDIAVLRVSAGRHGDTAALALDDTALTEAIAADLTTTMGLDGPLLEVRITRWDDALPQFRPGHLGRVRALRAELDAGPPGLVVAGAAHDGLGIPSCVRQARNAVQHLAEQGF
ncbi:MAG: protoporphyrinogen oxidase [Acidobacteria bacterium]|nr:protoporphyrinogen oxidase [Acidobacteriota bacterium]